MKLLIPVASGLEAALKRELSRLGYGAPPVLFGRAEVEGDWADVAKLNVRLRAGERVLLVLGRFRAETFDELFEGVRSIAWEEFLTKDALVRLDGKSVKSKLGAVKAAGGVAKKAIATRLGGTLSEKGERAVVGLSLLEDNVTVTLDTSGDGLHKRGYRVLTYEAPLRETVAAAVLEDSFYRAEKPFADPFAGSGTIPIEAVLYARSIAPGLMREFDFTRFAPVPKDVLPRAKEEARAEIYTGPIAPVFASDLSPRAVGIAKEHARRAGVLKDIRFEEKDVKDLSLSGRFGVLFSNPPYGERMEKGRDLFPLYREFSRAVRRYPDWSCIFLSAYEGAERAFGRADRRRILYNADLRSGLYTYFGRSPKGS